jgi:hypothetical protein
MKPIDGKPKAKDQKIVATGSVESLDKLGPRVRGMNGWGSA